MEMVGALAAKNHKMFVKTTGVGAMEVRGIPLYGLIKLPIIRNEELKSYKHTVSLLSSRYAYSKKCIHMKTYNFTSSLCFNDTCKAQTTD